MKTADILALAKAGFSATQIAAIAQQGDKEQTPAAEPQNPQPTNPAPENPAPGNPDPQTIQTAPANPAAVPQVDAILEKLGVLTTAIQNSAIMHTQQPATETADDILAAIIAPPIKKEV